MSTSIRRSIIGACCCAIALAAGSRSVVAQRSSSARASMVVTSAWLADHLEDPKLVLLQVGDRKEYDLEHLPGARFISLSDISISDHTSAHGLMLELPPVDSLRQALEQLGISSDSRIVVYYGSDWVTPSTRVIFTLDYAGLGASTVLLDGGMREWKREGHAVTSVVAAPSKGKLSPLHTKSLVVDAPWVKSHVGTPGVAVIDGRAASFYDGVDIGGGPQNPQRAGHVPGAKSIPFTEMTDEHDKLKSPAELAAIFAKAGVQPNDTVVGYCHIGQQATAVLFAARTLGHPVKLYDGSWQDWSQHADYAVESSSASRK